MNGKFIFFDFDGTISDARRIAKESLRRTLDDFGYKYDERKLGKLLGEKMEIIFQKLRIKTHQIRKVRRHFYKYFKAMALDGGIKLCISVEPLYELKKEGFFFVVISNSETSFIKASIRKLGIRKLFGKVYGAEKFRMKNELLKKLFRKYRIKPSETFYVGDRFSDVEFARKAGCRAVAIHNKCSWSTLSDVLKEKPDYLISDFEGLKKIVES